MGGGWTDRTSDYHPVVLDTCDDFCYVIVPGHSFFIPIPQHTVSVPVVERLYPQKSVHHTVGKCLYLGHRKSSDIPRAVLQIPVPYPILMQHVMIHHDNTTSKHTEWITSRGRLRNQTPTHEWMWTSRTLSIQYRTKNIERF